MQHDELQKSKCPRLVCLDAAEMAIVTGDSFGTLSPTPHEGRNCGDPTAERRHGFWPRSTVCGCGGDGRKDKGPGHLTPAFHPPAQCWLISQNLSSGNQQTDTKGQRWNSTSDSGGLWVGPGPRTERQGVEVSPGTLALP